MRKILSIIVIISMVFSVSGPAFAANGTWLNTGSTSANWTETTNWGSGTVPGSTGGSPFTNTDVATFNTAVGGSNYGTVGTPILIDNASENIGGITFDTSSVGAYYIGTTGGHSLLLSSGGTIQTTSTVANAEHINAPLVLEGNSGTYTFTSGSTASVNDTLNFGGGITAGGTTGTTTLTINGSNAGSNTLSGIIGNGGTGATLALVKSGAGKWILSGVNTYSGGTTISAGTLEATTSASALGAGTVTLSGGTLDLANNSGVAYDNNVVVSSSSTIDSDTLSAVAGVTHTLGTLSMGTSLLTVSLATNANSGTQGLTFGNVTLTGDGTISATTGAGGAAGLDTLGSVTGAHTFTLEGTVNTTITGAVTTTALQLGAGGATVTLDASSNITTTTFEAADTLALNGANLTGTVDFNNNTGTITVTSGNSINGAVENSVGGANKGTLTFAGSTTVSGGNIGAAALDTGLAAVNFNGVGASDTLADNIYATTTTLNNSATVNLSGNRSIVGNLTLAGTSTLNLGATSLTNNGTYTQGANTHLALTADSSSTYGNLTTNATAVVNASSAVNVTVAGYIPNGATLEVINTGGAGIGSVPTTVTSNDAFISFTDANVGGNLILTANHTGAGFASLANNSNAKAVGTVLDNETNPSTDLGNILNTLESSSSAQITAALNTMSPVVDRGIMDTSTASLNSFVGASFDRANEVLALASSNSTGVAAGDASPLNGLWGKQYGGYMDQGTRDGIEGYNSWNTGTAVGVDHLFNDNLTVGASLGYSYGRVDSDANSGNANINSAQGTVYAGYRGANLPYYVDLAGTIAENWYSGQREITVDTMNRIADSHYQGTQGGVYFEAGYNVDLGNSLQFTPLTSLQWTNLSINSYSETNAGDVGLNVNSQDYNTLESGLGASISYTEKYAWGNFIPEFHAKWLYDFIDDNMSVTSAFAGGGGSFTTNGVAPSRNGANVGGKLSFDFKNDVSLVGELNTEERDQFFGISGTVSVRYKF